MVLLAGRRAWARRSTQVGRLLGTAELDGVPIHVAHGIPGPTVVALAS
jgi:hypothetical protein